MLLVCRVLRGLEKIYDLSLVENNIDFISKESRSKTEQQGLDEESCQRIYECTKR